MAKKQHGGARPGSGRPVNPEGRTVVIAASVPESIADGLDSYVKANGTNRSKAVTEAIKGLLARKKSRG